ncbi:MAG: hypothetical protein NC177_04215 [Ruminococcus flavefaciens]|nr:hypothetical protein [Ruminococcus flavefaciens]
MKKLSTYILSLLISVLLVFMIIATAFVAIVRINVTETKSIQLAEENNIYSSARGELQKYFAGQYNTTGIPADVYMNALDESYIHEVTDIYTKALFTSLKSGEQADVEVPKNENLEKSIEDFFSSYADANNYEKDDVYNKKISSTIENAYRVTGNYCDIYKYSTLKEHGVLSKVSSIYSRIGKIMAVCIGVSAFLAVLLILVNVKSISSVLYWAGVSALVAGLLGTVPSAYLVGSNYFDAFVIKQPQVFRTFTGAMYGLTKAFMAVHIAVLLIGICFIVIYGVFNKLHKKSQ